MSPALIVATNILLFFTLYAQVLLLFTFFEKKNVFTNTGGNNDTPLKRYPIVTVIVPVWNEEKTLGGTIESLLALDYPKDKLDILIVDDGSTDNTRQVANTYKTHPEVRVFSKTNGGKHTAVNLGISKARGEFIGCLDADSYVDKNALSRIIRCFEDSQVMAVTPAIKVHTPTGALSERPGNNRLGGTADGFVWHRGRHDRNLWFAKPRGRCHWRQPGATGAWHLGCALQHGLWSDHRHPLADLLALLSSPG